MFYHQPFHFPISDEHSRLDCNVEWTNADKEINPESHNIWVQYTESDPDNTYQDSVPSFLSFYISWTQPNQILHFKKRLPTRKPLSNFPNQCNMTKEWILNPQAQEYGVVIWTLYKDPHGWADCIDWFIQVVKKTDTMHIVSFSATVGLPNLAWENAASDWINSIWLINNNVD
jgi:hypothetical protein